MPRYFFNLAGAIDDPDSHGIELPNISEARIMAAKHAGEYLRDRPEVAWLGDEFRIEVTNADGLIIFTFIALGVDAPAGHGK